MGTIKDRNLKDLIEAEEIKKKWKEYTEELYKRDLNDPGNHDSVIIHPEPDILECEVKWALGSTATNKAHGGYGIPAEIFKTLKDDAVKVLYSTCLTIWKIQQWPEDRKTSILKVNSHEAQCKEGSNPRTTVLISHANKVMLKILHAGFNIVNIFVTIKFKKKKNLGHGVVKASLIRVDQDLFTRLAAKGRKKYKGRAVCGCVHLHTLMITVDVCASLGCAIEAHC